MPSSGLRWLWAATALLGLSAVLLGCAEGGAHDNTGADTTAPSHFDIGWSYLRLDALSTATPTPGPDATAIVAVTTGVESSRTADSGGEVSGQPALSREDGVRSVVCAAPFTWPCDWALDVVFCESTYDPNAVAVEYINGEYVEFHGWFQVTWGSFDPYENAVEAHIQYVEWQRGERLRPWPNCP